MEPDSPLTNTRQRRERVVKGDGDKKEGNQKAALAFTAFYFWWCSVGQGFASPNPAGFLFKGLQRTKKVRPSLVGETLVP
ncbi:hypothetical protein I656_00899 [Geobacillus sp. WSUCF1]|nr:hypothetical protein I656_00899 [Geobacillus sp. WSUCF1]